MVDCYQAWKSLSLRIRFLANCTRNFYSNWSEPGLVSEGVVEVISKNINKCLNDLLSFQGNFKSSMPREASDLLNDFTKEVTSKNERLHEDIISGNVGERKYAIPTILALLELLESELSYLFSNTKIHVQKTVEVAFAHLQRHIVANKGVGIETGWIIGKSEPQLESLAGVHFLLHKIWACKINGQGERTDLVLPEKSVDSDQLNNNAMGIVLTEWKKIEENRTKKCKKLILTIL